jgi:hypothetical protein
MATLTDERSLLTRREDVESLKGGVQRIDPLRADVEFLELFSVDH